MWEHGFLRAALEKGKKPTERPNFSAGGTRAAPSNTDAHGRESRNLSAVGSRCPLMEPHKLREKPKIGIACIPDFFSKKSGRGFPCCTKKPALLMQTDSQTDAKIPLRDIFPEQNSFRYRLGQKNMLWLPGDIPIYLTNQGGHSR